MDKSRINKFYQQCHIRSTSWPGIICLGLPVTRKWLTYGSKSSRESPWRLWNTRGMKRGWETWFSLRKRRVSVGLIAISKYLTKTREKKPDSSWRCTVEEALKQVWKWKIPTWHRDFWISFFFTIKVVKYWNSLHREVADFPCLRIFKTQLDKAVSNQL